MAMDPRKLGLSEEDLAALGYRVSGRTGGTEGDAAIPPSGGDQATGRPYRPPSRGGSEFRRWLWTAGLVAAAAWGASTYRQRPAPVPANRADTVFSSGRAMSQLVEVARQPRVPGTPQHAAARAYLLQRLDALGWETEVHVDTVAVRSPETADVVTVRNVVARLPGGSPTGAVLVMAHYDTRPASPGAGDDGLGVASVLEAARVLASLSALRNDVVVLFADGLGSGHEGVAAFAGSHPLMADVSVAIAADMRGSAGPVWMLEEEEANEALLDVMAAAASRPVANSVTRGTPAAAEARTLLDPLRVRGVPSLALVGVGRRGVSGSALDVAEGVSERTLVHQGTELVGLTRYLADMELGTLQATSGSTQAYVSVTRLGLIRVPRAWALILLGVAAAAWMGLLALSRARSTSLARLLAGVATGLVITAGAAGLGYGLLELTRRGHPEYGRVAGTLWYDGIHVGALAAGVVAVTALVYGLVRRRFGYSEVVVGALSIPLGLAAWGTFAVPSAAPGLLLPLVAGILMAALALGAQGRAQGWIWTAELLLTAGVLAVAVPEMEWMAGSLTLASAPVLGALIAVAGLLLLPVFERLRSPRWWLTPGVGTTTAAALVVLALPAVQGEVQHPDPTALLLLVDDSAAVTRGASPLPTTDPDADANAPPSRTVSGTWLTVAGVGEAWARSWAVEGEVGARPPGDLLLPEGPSWIVAGAGTAAEMALPRLEVLPPDSAGEDRSVIRLLLHSGLGGEVEGVVLPDGAAIISVDGIELASPGGSAPVHRVRRWGNVGTTMRMTFRRPPGDGPISVDVIEHHLRPRTVVGEEFFVRDGTVVADALVGSDRIVQRVRFRLPAS